MIKVAVFVIVASLIAMKIKTIRPEIAVVIAVISSILLAMYGLKQMEEILTVFEMIRSYSKIPQSYFQILLKLIGISFICEFASNICKDAGQASIAKQIEFAGKLAILYTISKTADPRKCKRCSAYDQSQNERGLFKPYVDPKRPDQRNPSDRIYRSHI